MPKELSNKQKHFQEFFFNLLDEFEVDSPAELEEKKKIEFFNQVKKGWKKYKKEVFNENCLPIIQKLIKENKKVNTLIRSYLNK